MIRKVLVVIASAIALMGASVGVASADPAVGHVHVLLFDWYNNARFNGNCEVGYHATGEVGSTDVPADWTLSVVTASGGYVIFEADNANPHSGGIVFLDADFVCVADGS